jgi:hypothetical protein
MKLQVAWTSRLKLRAEGERLRAEADRFWAEADRFWADADRLWAKGERLRADADRLWAEAIIEVYGNIRIEWKFRDGVVDCHLETGEIFRGDQSL